VQKMTSDPTKINSAVDATLVKKPASENAATADNATRVFITDDATRVKATSPVLTPSTDVVIGDIIKGRFVLDSLLGSGGMGSVYRALDLRKKEARDNKPYVALKLLGEEFKDHPEALIALQREARKTQELAHPNIVTVYDFDRDGDLIYLTMEELKGKSLDEFILTSRASTTLDEKLYILQQIAQGLYYAHSKGIVHSDLKPANIFITNTNTVKILDFGIARAINSEIYEDSFDAGDLGAVTFAYGSLEMLNFDKPHPSDDIYALGIIACELLGKHHPYNRQNAQQVLQSGTAPNLPPLKNPLLKKLLLKSIAIKREDRIQSAAEFIKQLKFARNGIRKVTYIVTLVLLALIGNFVYWHYFGSHEVAFSDLPTSAQQDFKNYLKEAETALSFEDLQGAVVNIDHAYSIHTTQKDMLALRDKVVKIINQNLATADTDIKRSFYQQQLDQLKTYPAFAKVTTNK
jgi:serine/threonine protein kinase